MGLGSHPGSLCAPKAHTRDISETPRFMHGEGGEFRYLAGHCFPRGADDIVWGSSFLMKRLSPSNSKLMVRFGVNQQ